MSDLDSFTLTPAYGRDYFSAEEARNAFLAGKDWRISSPFGHHTYTSVRDYQLEGVKSAKLRFNRLTEVTLCTIPEAKDQ